MHEWEGKRDWQLLICSYSHSLQTSQNSFFVYSLNFWLPRPIIDSNWHTSDIMYDTHCHSMWTFGANGERTHRGYGARETQRGRERETGSMRGSGKKGNIGKNGEITRAHNYLAISEEPLETGALSAPSRILENPLLWNISSVKVIFGEFPLLGAQPQHDDAI